MSPSLANSRTNWMVKTMPTNAEVSSATPRELGPTSFSCSAVFFQCTLPEVGGGERGGEGEGGHAARGDGSRVTERL